MEEEEEILVMNKKNMISENHHRCWLHLPHEIVELIMKRLFYADLLNFRFVCKLWNSINRGVTVPLKQSPWLLMFDRIKFTKQSPSRASAKYCEMVRNWKKTSEACSCKLFDPVYKKTYTINNMTNNININLFLIGSSVHASKHGWILVSSSDHFGITHSSLFFAYTPFSAVNNFIELPALESSHYIRLATFTSNPSIMGQEEEDGLFVVLHNPGWKTVNNYVHQAIIISTWRPGEKSWNSQCLKYIVPVLEFHSYTVRQYSERWIYSEGNIYYMTHLGKQLGQGQTRFVVKWEFVRVVKWEWESIMKGRHGHGNHEEEYHEVYGSVMNKELLDHDDDDLLSKLEKDHFSTLNYFAQPLRTAGTEYESCHTDRNRKMIKIDPPHI